MKTRSPWITFAATIFVLLDASGARAADSTSYKPVEVPWQRPSSAARADSAGTAGTADYATTAGTVGYAASAGTADYANSANNANTANNANYANSSGYSSSSGYAASAGYAASGAASVGASCPAQAATYGTPDLPAAANGAIVYTGDIYGNATGTFLCVAGVWSGNL